MSKTLATKKAQVDAARKSLAAHWQAHDNAGADKPIARQWVTTEQTYVIAAQDRYIRALENALKKVNP
jgi:hypothetical protein